MNYSTEMYRAIGRMFMYYVLYVLLYDYCVRL